MGKYAHNFVDLTGMRFERILVLKRVGTGNGRAVLWDCLCDCGTKKNILGKSLKAGKTKSCGCLKVELENKRAAESKGKPRIGHYTRDTHNGSNTPLYGIWSNMKTRCNNPNFAEYKNYGGRGIKICDKWLKFEAFREDMESTYRKGLTIERLDNDKGYSPDNCKWATRKEQSSNQRSNRVYTIMGVTGNVTALCKTYNMPYHTIIDRLNKGVDPLTAFTAIYKNGTNEITGYITYGG